MFRRFKNIKNKIKLYQLKKEGLTIGENCEIGANVNFGTEPYLITIGNNVRVSSNCIFITHDGGLWTLRKMKLLENADFFNTITIGDNVNIGMNVAIMPGVKIGNNCVVGYGSVVTHDVPDNTVVAGVPAKKIETIEEYYEKKKEKVVFTKNYSNKQKKDYLKHKFHK